MGENRDFIFDVPVDHSKSQSVDDMLSQFKFLIPLKYLWNGLSQRL